MILHKVAAVQFVAYHWIGIYCKLHQDGFDRPVWTEQSTQHERDDNLIVSFLL